MIIGSNGGTVVAIFVDLEGLSYIVVVVTAIIVARVAWIERISIYWDLVAHSCHWETIDSVCDNIAYRTWSWWSDHVRNAKGFEGSIVWLVLGKVAEVSLAVELSWWNHWPRERSTFDLATWDCWMGVGFGEEFWSCRSVSVPGVSIGEAVAAAETFCEGISYGNRATWRKSDGSGWGEDDQRCEDEAQVLVVRGHGFKLWFEGGIQAFILWIYFLLSCKFVPARVAFSSSVTANKPRIFQNSHFFNTHSQLKTWLKRDRILSWQQKGAQYLQRKSNKQDMWRHQRSRSEQRQSKLNEESP